MNGHVHMIHNHKKTRVHRFYVPESQEPMIADLQEILATEGKSLSQWIRDNAEPYVRLHKPGNPQTHLDITLKLGRSYRANGCLDCGGKPSYQVQINGVKAFMCTVHFQKARLQEKLQGWKPL